MIKTTINAGSYTSGNIPATIYKNTNDKYSYANDTFSVKTNGLTRLIANIVVTATASGDISLIAYADGNPISGAIDTQTLTTGDTYTLHINDIIRTVLNSNNTFAQITFGLSGACTLVGGDEILLYER